MSNMPAVDKKRVSLLLPIRVVVKVDRAAKILGLSRNEITSAILDKGTADVQLTHEDIDAISKEMEDNLAKRTKF